MAEARFGYVRVCLVERLLHAATCVWHAKYAAKQLLDRRRRSHGLHRAQDVCERTVPAFAQRLHGDDETDGTVGRAQVHAFQPARIAGRDGDLPRRNVQLIDQMLLQRINVNRLGPVLRLKKYDRSNVVSFLLRFGFQLALRLHGIEHRRLPALRMFHEDDRKLDHVLRRKLLGRDVIENVGMFRDGRGGQFQNCRWVEPLQCLEASLGLRVVRLIDDDQGLLQSKPVGKRVLRLADIALYRRFRIGRILHSNERVRNLSKRRKPVRRQTAKMGLECFAERIHVAQSRFLDAERLDRRHHDDGLAPPIMRRNRGDAFQIAHLEALAIGLFQRFTVRVPRSLQRAQRLGANRVGWRQPQRGRSVAVLPFLRHAHDRV